MVAISGLIPLPSAGWARGGVAVAHLLRVTMAYAYSASACSGTQLASLAPLCHRPGAV